MQFDNSGRPVSQQVSYNGTTEVGAGAYNYTSTTDTSDSKNKIADAASLGKNTVNMLVNGGCETTGSWAQNTNVADASADHYTATGIQYVGKNCLAVRNVAPITTTVNTNYGQTVTGWATGKTYTFSAFVRTLNLTQLNKGGLEGAYLQITATGTTDTENVYSQVLTSDTDEAVNNGWRRLSATITLDSDTTKVTVFMCLRNATGNAYFDNAQLETGSTPNSVNLLNNSSFETLDSNGSLAYWVKENITADDGRNSEVSQKDGSYVVKINGDVNKAKTYSQTIDVQPNPNDTYIVSGWAAAYAVSSNYHNHYTNKGEELDDDDALKILGNTNEDDDKDIEVVEDSKFEIDVSVIYKDENNNTKTQHKASAKFNTAINVWQYSSAPIVLKYVYDKYSSDDDGKTYTPYQLKVSLVYTNQANHAYFDHVQLVKDVAQSYTYDDEGNVVSVSANAEQKNDMTYDPDSNDLKTYKDAGGNETTFNYDDNHNVTKVTSPKGVKTQYTYNSVGLNTVTETVNTAGNARIKTTTAHTGEYDAGNYTIDAGAYVRYSNDQHGYTTTYGYDMPTGTVTSVTSPNGLVTSSSYDSKFTKLLGVSAQNTSVKYTYDNNRLKTISFGYGSNNTFNETYNFLYDVYGNVTETRVDDKTLSTNHYLPYNGGLDETVYGNNDGIKYGYNYSGNVTAIYYKDNANGSNSASYNMNAPAFTWQYSSNGTPRVHKDGYTGLRYDYGYDAIGRLIRTDISKSSNGAAVGSTEYGYNTRGHLTSITNDIGGNAYGQYYSYSQTDIEGSLANAIDGLPTRYRALGVNTDYAYDSLNRLTKRNVDLATDIETLYTYKDSALRGTGYTTTQLATEKLGGISYGYSYDNMGNITSIVKGSNEYRSYLYDSLGQLTQERNVSSSTMTSFSYNHLGNIVEKHINDYNGINEKAKVRYGYSADSNAGWNYLLTSITTEDYTSGTTVTTTETINYDAIGNPITYRGAAMAWRGRQLTGHTKNGVTSTFSYDADGLRSSKTVGGVKTEYQYVGDQLFYEKRGDSQEFYYFYDSYGNLSKIYYTFTNVNNNTTSRAIYHALTNAQGDVIALYNGSGTLVAQYEYDAWGNTLSIKNASGATIDAWYNIAVANPIRYRGYYYDDDLGLYYLQSRYYDSDVGRFINADSEISSVGGNVLGNNSFAYCHNNPVNMSDPTGHWPSWKTIALGVAAAAVAVAVTVVTLGAAAPAAACTLAAVGMSYGVSYAAATAVATVAVNTVVAVAATYAADVAYSSVTGNSFLLDTVFQGNTEAYDVGMMVTSFATAGMLELAAQSPGVCFVAGTYVLSQFGQVEIEKIKVGDKVWAENPETGEKALKTVVQTFVNESNELIHLFVNDEEIITTPNHPFYVPQKGWVSAINLRAGDILVLANGKYVILEQVQHEILETPVTVYNFEVEDFHTYYVGDSSVLVHNANCGIKPTSPNQLNRQVEKSQAPRGIEHVHNYHVPGQKPHIHWKDGTTLNLDGTIHDKSKGIHVLTRDEKIWLFENGWGEGK